jgi:hypothetical protein
MNKEKGKPKIPPTTSEEQQIVTLAAGGMSTTRIAQTLGRSRGFVKHTVNEPGIQCAISEEKAELSLIFKAKSRAIIESIDGDVIEKGNLLQRATSAAICLDKSLLLSGDLPQVSVTVLLDLVTAARDVRDAEDARLRGEYCATHKLPATITGQ